MTPEPDGARLVSLLEGLTEINLIEVSPEGRVMASSHADPIRPGARLADLLLEGQGPLFDDTLSRVLGSGQPLSLEAALVEADGSTHPVHLHLVRTPTDPFRVLVVARWIRATETGEADALVGTLASGIAHEVNNPLATVIANLDLALMDVRECAERIALPEELVDELTDAREAAERVRAIMRDLRLFSGPDLDRIRPIDVSTILESTLRISWNEIRHRARLTKQYGHESMVEASEGKLGLAFLNLVLYLVRMLPEGRAHEFELRATTRSSDPWIEVELETTAVDGVPRPPHGEGTSLAVAWHHLSELGGSLQVESDGGMMGRLLARLPRAHETEPLPETGPAVRRGRVLSIDDEVMIGQIVRRVLGFEHDVVTLTSAGAALELLHQGERFDVMLCDVMMPDVSGVDFYGLVRDHYPDELAKVVFITGGTFTSRARAFLQESDVLRIEKPFDAQVLRAVVNDRIR